MFLSERRFVLVQTTFFYAIIRNMCVCSLTNIHSVCKAENVSNATQKSALRNSLWRFYLQFYSRLFYIAFFGGSKCIYLFDNRVQFVRLSSSHCLSNVLNHLHMCCMTSSLCWFNFNRLTIKGTSWHFLLFLTKTCRKLPLRLVSEYHYISFWWYIT